jgi:ADP-ribosylglycohydrolase
MRVSAVGWFFDTLEETERVAKISAEITHNHPEGIKGAQATAAAIWMARNGKSKAEIKKYIETKYEYDLDRTWEYLNQRYGWKSSCQETVPEAIIAFLESNSFEDAIRKAVSMGGDSDTLACITGGIAEAFYGQVPNEMIEVTQRVFPPIFNRLIDAMRKKTFYRK